ncbi:flagellar basal body rod protein FlgB [Desulforamulus hydrothermalis]|uniref:Flagellar basal body rod protein FlgB n=1 Tax=Desulforamulus hydrothermalis Lam5 = DSM 18033 TaxID=1121428 RepID=K8E0M3_9FIRM|nr:flagellar basal body rod protein FlgB [Desulforamulus hydrothermalis]CCO09159.1 Flagellar basal-body rod protein FlgB [Desulforamulus hydrothermalis Lam5 = DSM 18033]SHH11505.1 flagellar basal-body rod protein FlgB [Desulforamulus hydrothermalis Lam5 = DSM 18033]
MHIFDSPVINVLKQGLDAGSLRQRVIAHNLANLNTPGFKKSYVSFEDRLKAALSKEGVPLKGTHPLHMGTAGPAVKPEVKQVKDSTMRYDGNNVDIDEEMVNLAAATIQYDLLGQGLIDRYNILSLVIGGRR